MKKLASILLSLSIVLASDFVQAQDIKDSKDHPVISRYKGAEIKAFAVIDYDEYNLGIGPEKSGVVKTKLLEGKITTIIYSADNKLSTLQIYRNYRSGLNLQGFKEIFSCTNKNCGHFFPRELLKGTNSEITYLPMDIYNLNEKADFRYISGTLVKKGKPVYISLLISKNKYSKAVFIGQEIIELTEMLKNQVTIDLTSLEQHIQDAGKATLHGISFEYNSATLTKESSKVVNVLAQYLNKHPQNKYFVVGHTDNQGSYSYNLNLSKNRADTIKKVLVKDGITDTRLSSVGIAQVSPITSNSSDQGRQQNRRVELVLVN